MDDLKYNKESMVMIVKQFILPQKFGFLLIIVFKVYVSSYICIYK